MPSRTVLTYSGYAALPDDGRRHELHRALDGTVYTLAGRLSGEPAALPPFSDLIIDPEPIGS